MLIQTLCCKNLLLDMQNETKLHIDYLYSIKCTKEILTVGYKICIFRKELAGRLKLKIENLNTLQW